MPDKDIKTADAGNDNAADPKTADPKTADPKIADPKIAASKAKVKTEEIFVERGSANDEPNLLISINGQNFLLPRGKTSTVPYYVAEEYRRSQRARAIMDEHIDSMLGASK